MMGRNEIRLRRNPMSSGRIARHRNYSELMRQHDKEIRLKRVLKVFTYFLIILFLIILLLIVLRWERKHHDNATTRIPKETGIKCALAGIPCLPAGRKPRTYKSIDFRNSRPDPDFKKSSRVLAICFFE